MGTLGCCEEHRMSKEHLEMKKKMLEEKLRSFLTVSAVIYFAVVMPMSKLMEKMNGGKSTATTEKVCPECASLIPVAAKKCKYRTSALAS